MKIAVRVLFIVLLSSTYDLQAMELEDLVCQKQSLIKENFESGEHCPHCITPKEKFLDVNAEFYRLTNYFHNDMDLKYYYALFLMERGHRLKGLSIYAEVVKDYDTTTPYRLELFIAYLKSISINKIALKNYIDPILSIINKWEDYSRINSVPQQKFQSKNSKKLPSNNIRTNLFIEYSEKLFDILKKIGIDILFDVTLNIINKELDTKNLYKMKADLLYALYMKDQNPSVFLRESYARNYLLMHSKYDEAISLYELVLEKIKPH